MKPRTQSEHEAYNELHYPGTRQPCVYCEKPTDRCEDDSLYLEDETGPVCENCFHVVVKEGS